MLNSILPFIVLILVVVFIHEYGHYYFAKKYGVMVTDFSIGFGKELFGWNDKSGTRWKICWIPLGGYVKFFGDRNVFSQADQEKIINKYSVEDQKKLFVLKPLYQRAIIVADGGRIGYKFGNRVDDLVDNTGIKDIGLEQQVKARMEIFNEDYDTALQKVLESIGKSTDNIISGTEVMEPSDLGMNIIRDTGVTPNFASLPTNKMKKFSYKNKEN